MPSACAYCGSTVNKLTREHLFPKAIDALLTEGEQTSHYFLHRSPARFVIGEPVIKDVCAKCNNNILGALDGYVLKLFRTHCNRYVNKGDRITIPYDYDLLLRWLLK